MSIKKIMDTNNLEINSIEKKLDSILQPVNPEESYITSLKRRLLNESGVTVEKPDYLFILLIIGSLFFFGIILVWLLNYIFNRKTD